jgi:hypothetical protein
MAISLWNVFSLPVDIAFEPPLLQTFANAFINHIIDLMFLIDILLNFRTTIINEATGIEIVEPKAIAR